MLSWELPPRFRWTLAARPSKIKGCQAAIIAPPIRPLHPGETNLPEPQLRPRSNRRVLVLGGGVSGLTSAICLRQRGFEVTVVAGQFAPRVTSTVAGALWEWPPAVCGHHVDLLSLERSKQWCRASLQRFIELAENPSTGVFLRPVTFYFRRPLSEQPGQMHKLNELRRVVGDAEHDAGLIEAQGINPRLGYRDAYRHLAPMIDTDAYLRWLMEETVRLGCQIEQRMLSGRLADQAAPLRQEYGACAIVNCTGLGAKELTEDETLYPLRGALIRVHNDGRTMPRITAAHCVSNDGSGDNRGFIFVVPRGNDMLLLGGLAEPHESQLDVGLHNYDPIREMHARCVEFLPLLSQAVVDSAEPVRVGLRPFRDHVRLEREPGRNIVHNYGHGGSGVTLSWGCADDAANLVASLMGSTSSHPEAAHRP